jgi:hypothetical protein
MDYEEDTEIKGEVKEFFDGLLSLIDETME